MSPRTSPGRRGCPGFTLVELLVAMFVGGLVMLAARMLVVQLADSTRRLQSATAAADAAANSERVVRGLVSRLEVGTDATLTFEGSGHQARFTSWCDVAGGWQERCVVTMSILPATPPDSGEAFVVAPSLGDPVVLRTGIRSGTLGYLTDARESGQWIRSWASRITAPLAIGAVLETGRAVDTLVIRVGGRG
jgi:prepilin-type N-terminal cleavage/methylation domain-containing protein